jgi:LysM repeat protein
MKRVNQLLKLALIINFQLLIFNCFGQTDSLEVHTIKGKAYYIHIIQKGESLYFIHNKYTVPLEVLKKENPSVTDGLSIGEKLFIPVKRNTEHAVKTDGNFINHTVRKKQTLYSIAKLYDVKQKEIIAANAELTDGLKEEQVLKIPLKEIKVKVDPEPIIILPLYKTHTVLQGETLYSLSRTYKTTPDSIRKINDGLKQGLKTNELIYVPEKMIKIPLPKKVEDTNLVLVPKENLIQWIVDTGIVVKKSEYSIGLMLPFYLDENDEIVENRNVLTQKSIYSKSKFAIEFYNGFKIALDSISSDSCHFKIHVYDTKGNDSLTTQLLLLKPEMVNHDLIVGPLYFNNFKQVAAFAKENKIPIVSPVKQSNKLLLGNPYIFKAIPSKSTTLSPISKLVADSFKTENLLAISYLNAKEKSMVNQFIKSYNIELLSTDDTAIYSAITVLEINQNLTDVVNHLKKDKNNIIFVPATDQTFITNLFNTLSTTLNHEDYETCKITLIGMEEWMSYENIDLEYFQQLNVHFCSTRYINYQDSLTNNFIKTYKEITQTYPSQNSFLGFDIGYFFVKNFADFGTLFSPEALLKKRGMSLHFNFFKTGIESGFENKNSYLLRFEDYELKRIVCYN